MRLGQHIICNAETYLKVPDSILSNLIRSDFYEAVSTEVDHKLLPDLKSFFTAGTGKFFLVLTRFSSELVKVAQYSSKCFKCNLTHPQM